MREDETPVPVQTGKKSGGNHSVHLWEYSESGRPVVFDFRIRRGREGRRGFGRNSEAYLKMTDRRDALRLGVAGLWRHRNLRRRIRCRRR